MRQCFLPACSFLLPDTSTCNILRTLAPPVRASTLLLPENDEEDIAEASSPRLAICFFGQVKNIEEDHARAFIQHVVRPLMACYPQIDVYVHTYNMVRFSNPRNEEDDVAIDVVASLERLVTMLRQVEPPGRISLKGLQITEPLDADKSFHPLEFYLSRGDPWDNEGISMFNLLRQLYSLDQVTQQWERDKEPDHYAAVVYTRPDLLFHTMLPLVASEEDARHTLLANALYAPQFDEFRGLNDRFAFGSSYVMRVYGHRMNYIESYFERYPEGMLWSETYLQRVMVEMYGLAYIPLKNFSFSRVRATGCYRSTR